MMTPCCSREARDLLGAEGAMLLVRNTTRHDLEPLRLELHDEAVVTGESSRLSGILDTGLAACFPFLSLPPCFVEGRALEDEGSAWLS
jgi:hypothetical protein